VAILLNGVLYDLRAVTLCESEANESGKRHLPPVHGSDPPCILAYDTACYNQLHDTAEVLDLSCDDGVFRDDVTGILLCADGNRDARDERGGAAVRFAQEGASLQGDSITSRWLNMAARGRDVRALDER
jgi:hypothetical protein